MQNESDRVRGNPISVVGQAFARNVRRYRRFNEWSLRDMADRLEQSGRPMSLSALSKIENATRRVDVDDAEAIALVLGVSFESLTEVRS